MHLFFSTPVWINQINNFETINNDSKKDNKQIRTYTLPSDRTAKNFYESNRITARVLIMEQKRTTSRYKI